jgi:predicted XRE-type DNA-binding protein
VFFAFYLVLDIIFRMEKKQTFSSVWDALTDTPQEAANLTARNDLIDEIIAIIKANGWKQAEAAARLKLTQPRVSDLLNGRIDRFSLDALINIAATLGRKIQLVAA